MSVTMSDAIQGVANLLTKPFMSFVVKRIQKYFHFIKNYDKNMKNLEKELKVLCSKKLDIDTKVKADTVRLRVMTIETANWLLSVQDLIEREEMKKLMKDGRVAENVVKMMDQRVMKRLLEEDRETFDVVVRMVIKNCSRRDGDDGNGEVVDAQVDVDYQKIAKIAGEVMADTVEDFKKFVKEGDGAVSVVKQLSNDVLEKLMKIDDEMAKALTKAEEINRKDIENDDHGDKNVKRVSRSDIQENVGHWHKRMGSLKAFLDDENFKKSLPDGVRLGLEGMLALSTSVGYEHKEVNAVRQHKCCGCCVSHLDDYRHRLEFSKNAEIMAKEIKAMIDRCPQGCVTRLKRADELETVSCEFTEGLESREQLLQHILSALKDVRVNVVGIHGMGGAGKYGMMLVERIPRWMSKETLKKVGAISLLSGHHDFSSLSGVKAPMLRILLLKGDISTTTLSSNFFQGMTNLKVLSLSEIDFVSGLPASIQHLRRLQTLHLHKCRLKDIKLIAKLVNLFVLSLRGSTFEELPVEFGELCNLRLLDIRVDGIEIKINIPRTILSRLPLLEGLYTSNCFNDLGDQAAVSELNNLSHLNVLEMEVPQVKQLLTVNDDQLVEQLDDFKIFVGCCGSDEVLYSRSINFILRQWELPLRHALILGGIDASRNKFLNAILKKTLCLVVVNNASLTENFVPQLDEEGFEELICLSVINHDGIQYIIRPDNYGDSPAFVNLEHLVLTNMASLKMICDGNTPARSFRRLQKLKLHSLPCLRYGLPLIVVPLNLVEVDICECDCLEYIICGENVTTDIIKFSFLKTMKLFGVARLSSVLGQAFADDDDVQADQPFFHKMCAFPCLEKLHLEFNTRITTFWGNTYDISSFHNLKEIRIYGCKELRSLASPSIFQAFVYLERLTIMNCDKLQHIITRETTECQIPEHVIVLARLKHLYLCDLSSLESFYGGSYKLEFPNLVSLRLHSLRLTHLVGSENSTSLFCDKSALSSIEHLELWDNQTIVTLWSETVNVSDFQYLKVLDIWDCKELQCLGPMSVFAALVQLEELEIRDCHNLQQVICDEGHEACKDIIAFSRLKRIHLDKLPNLQTFYGGYTDQLKFPSLEKLEGDGTNFFLRVCPGAWRESLGEQTSF